MKTRQRILAGVVLLLCSRHASLQAAVPQSQQEKEVVKAFNKTIRDYIPTHIDKEPMTFEVPCLLPSGSNTRGWRKRYYDPAGTDYTIDVRKTDSLVSPYVGTVVFAVTLYWSACHPTEESAKKDDSYPEHYNLTHRFTFSYQDDAWVVKAREYKVEYKGRWGNWGPCAPGPDSGGCL
jgi:hypothetical protein